MRFLFSFLVCIALYSCQPEIDPSILTNHSQFSLAGSPNTCSRVVPAGTYKKNTPLTATNKITVDVNVTQIGSWTASANTVNGVSFFGTASFSATGAQTITLQGSGMPTLAGQNTFVITAGGSTCGFVLNVDTSSSPPPVNIPPVANAGPDKTITSPASSVTLTGSGTDADGTITSYLWSKIAGPNTFAIVTPTQAQTSINSLGQGTYQFELKVTDNLGATGKDTVSVTVQVSANPGTLSLQQELFAVVLPVNNAMTYDANGKIIKIASNHYPEMRISYSNNRIATVEYWFTNGSGSGMYKGLTNNFVYDANGNVITINQTDNVAIQTYLFAEFTYNTNNTIKTKKTYFPGGSTLTDNAYTYTSGNLTSIIEFPGSPSPTSMAVSYDTRTNNFKNIYPQYYFLDIQTTFAQTNRSEIFYFSNNYPTNIDGSLPVSVTINNTNQKPAEVKFDNVLWYRYSYN